MARAVAAAVAPYAVTVVSVEPGISAEPGISVEPGIGVETGIGVVPGIGVGSVVRRIPW